MAITVFIVLSFTLPLYDLLSFYLVLFAIHVQVDDWYPFICYLMADLPCLNLLKLFTQQLQNTRLQTLFLHLVWGRGKARLWGGLSFSEAPISFLILTYNMSIIIKVLCDDVELSFLNLIKPWIALWSIAYHHIIVSLKLEVQKHSYLSLNKWVGILRYSVPFTLLLLL